jgi:hypothetical protein
MYRRERQIERVRYRRERERDRGEKDKGLLTLEA